MSSHSNRNETAAWLKVHLHQMSASMLRQLCDDASNSVLIENNGVTPEWGCNPFLSDSQLFSMRKVSLASLQNCRSANAWCKRVLMTRLLLIDTVNGFRNSFSSINNIGISGLAAVFVLRVWGLFFLCVLHSSVIIIQWWLMGAMRLILWCVGYMTHGLSYA